ncbi:hypothetical protein IFM89_036193 [Coptis chinensis]|uniref:Uncharacterized protein n=1 Tax=Coptis chinensis TaxID=261450 RepID=A0A835IVJ3_9MAGN|nr:hypothetical protein IFM89_036193 [Coptis chinensis]
MVGVFKTSSCSLFFFFFLHISAWAFDIGSIIATTTTSVLSRHDFPPGFVFGAGTSAYQVEGATAEDGRKPSIWDTFTQGGRTPDKGTGDIASDQYHKYKDDVKLMHKMGLDAYRFSISWSRLIPDGHGAVNPKGLNYYNNLIDQLVSYGIEPHVTLNHFDIPQALQDEYEGYLSPKFIEDFTAYADVCFKEFGDRVNTWMTFNEPNIWTIGGNSVGMMPPGRCSYPFGVNCTKGDSTTEPYIGAHIILLSHAAAVHLYRTTYQEKQRGQIGITLLGFWFEPMTNSPQDIAAAKRTLDFLVGWFLEPLVYGRYPAVMRKIIGSRLPYFKENEQEQIKGSFDFIGLNHYCGFYVQDVPKSLDKYGRDYFRDMSAKSAFTDGLQLRLTEGWAPDMKPDGMIVGWGLRRLLDYVKVNYNNPATFIHENGYPMNVDDSSNTASRNDTERIEYLKIYIENLLLSVRNGSNARGYFVWSFLDVFEALGGYTSHFGLYGVDFSNKDRRRYTRQSVHWYTTFLAKTGSRTETSKSFFVQ